jgi:hypothetical protein
MPASPKPPARNVQSHGRKTAKPYIGHRAAGMTSL